MLPGDLYPNTNDGTLPPSDSIYAPGTPMDDFFVDTEVSDDDLPSTDSVLEYIANLIKRSPLYQQAYQVFSSDTRYGSPYLSQLQAIPYSATSVDPSFIDNLAEFFNITSAYEKRIADIYNNAMTEIQNLLSAYYDFRNSLPVEQVQQLADAGINSAVTGQGIVPSSRDTSAVTQPSSSMSEYTNDELSQGVTSFVEFVNLVSSLATSGVNAASVIGMLDLAEREGYSKQQLQDLLLAQLGISNDSPYSVSSSMPGLTTVKSTGKARQAVENANAVSDASALDDIHEVSLGNDPNSVQAYERLSGRDVLNQISRFALITRLSRMYSDYLTNLNNQLYADEVSRLSNEYNISNLGFQANYFNSRNGFIEGASTTDQTSFIKEIYKNDLRIKRFDAMIRDYREKELLQWSNNMKQDPSLAPYYYKAVFDFGMDETFLYGTSLPGLPNSNNGLAILRFIASLLK